MPLYIKNLLAKYIERQGLCEEELRMLEVWWEERGETRLLAELLADEKWVAMILEESEPPSAKRVWSRRAGRLLVAAAILLLVLEGGLFFHETKQQDLPAAPTSLPAGASIPKAGGVLFIGSDHHEVDIDDLPVEAIVSREGNYRLRKTDTNSVAFELQKGKAVAPPATGKVMLRLITGGKHAPIRLRMPDGSTVCLAGGSELSFPLECRTAKRAFSLDGEAFFDVIADPAKPLDITTPRGDTIRVLGTAFSVKAYQKDGLTTVSLYTGALKILNKRGGFLLHSYHKAIIGNDLPIVRGITDSVAKMGWWKKPAFFDFDKTDLKTVLEQVAFRYGCTVANPDGVEGIPITGPIPQYPQLDKVLQTIERVQSGHAYLKVEEKVIRVSRTRF